jgi:hypothetical protein
LRVDFKCLARDRRRTGMGAAEPQGWFLSVSRARHSKAARNARRRDAVDVRDGAPE